MMHRICIDAPLTLICSDLRDRVVDEGGWSDSHTGWTKAHLSLTQVDQNQRTKPKIWVQTLLALVIGIDKY